MNTENHVKFTGIYLITIIGTLSVLLFAEPTNFYLYAAFIFLFVGILGYSIYLFTTLKTYPILFKSILLIITTIVLLVTLASPFLNVIKDYGSGVQLDSCTVNRFYTYDPLLEKKDNDFYLTVEYTCAESKYNENRVEEYYLAFLNIKELQDISKGEKLRENLKVGDKHLIKYFPNTNSKIYVDYMTDKYLYLFNMCFFLTLIGLFVSIFMAFQIKKYDLLILKYQKQYENNFSKVYNTY